MKTVKLPYSCTDPEFGSFLAELRRKQSSYTRSAYQLFKTGFTQKEVQQNQSLKSRVELDSWFKQCAVMEAKAIHTRNKNKKVVFGGRANFMKRLHGKITREEWRRKRLQPLVSQGEASKAGNRKFKLEVETNSLVFKADRRLHFWLQLPNLRRKLKQELEQLETLAQDGKISFQVQLDENYIWISFDPSILSTSRVDCIKGRWMAIDQNPNNLGLAVLERGKDGDIKTLFQKEYSIKALSQQLFDLKGLPTTHPKMAKINNKLKHETVEIAKDIARVAKHYRVEGLFLEDLNFKTATPKWKSFNRLVNNIWKRNLFVNNITKRLKIQGQRVLTVGAAYSSQIGNLKYDFNDAVNAALEIGRRGIECRIEKDKKKRKFYPDFNMESLKDQWKDHFRDINPKSWKDIFPEIKNLGLRYRVSGKEKDLPVFSLNCKQSRVVYCQSKCSISI